MGCLWTSNSFKKFQAWTVEILLLKELVERVCSYKLKAQHRSLTEVAIGEMNTLYWCNIIKVISDDKLQVQIAIANK